MKFKSLLLVAGGISLCGSASYAASSFKHAENLGVRKVVKTVGKALMKGDQATVRTYLTGPALERYSGPNTMASLGAELQGFKDFDVGHKKYMGEANGMSHYTVRVKAERPGSGRDIQLFDVNVACVGSNDVFPGEEAYGQSYDQSYGQAYDQDQGYAQQSVAQQNVKREDDNCKIENATALYAFAAFGGGVIVDQGQAQGQSQDQGYDQGYDQGQDQGAYQDQGQQQDLGQQQGMGQQQGQY
jgi:hypothetical protein